MNLCVSFCGVNLGCGRYGEHHSLLKRGKADPAGAAGHVWYQRAHPLLNLFFHYTNWVGRGRMHFYAGSMTIYCYLVVVLAIQKKIAKNKRRFWRPDATVTIT